jgi:hypothetical protein
VEGPTAAGPIGGTDIQSATLPPAGVYGGVVGLGVATRRFVDGNGNTVPALAASELSKEASGPWLLYVSGTRLFGGSIGIGAIVPFGNQCGHLFAGEADHCTAGMGDPYVEIDWSRSFGKLRASKFQGANPIFEGLSILAGLGVVLPLGEYDASTPTEKALSVGTNIWDVAPSIALTYTTPPIFFEGTEFSGKLFWNNYATNPTTNYLAGDLLDLDFAVTEHIGRFQVGLAGAYAVQVEDDKVFGQIVPPDGNRGELLQLGCVVNYDMPELGSAIKLKASTSVLARNTVEYSALVLGWAKKF